VYAYEILNAQTDNNKKPQLAAQVRLFHDGQQVYTGTPAAMNGENQPNPRRLFAVGRLQLDKAPAGDYLLQVVVTDKLAKEKYRIAAQSMDFEIQ
jgi:hypothetical protein